MFVVTLTYLTDLDRADAVLPDHLAWVDRQYADGVFLASGRRVPRTGGVILAAGLDRAELDRRLATDPFAEQGIAAYEVVEFIAGRVAEGLEPMREG
ncbi:YciI family protein [Micromonospora siamensis]|uniref:YciI family protein n=1 Tax=Micromonospora siamensis TaxID=299152 RepID=UPI000B5AF558|nr:YciI family protein [Micromonospora siamensis]